MTAHRAVLACMFGVYPNDPPTSFLRFVGEDCKKLRPACIQHPFGGAGASQADGVQVFVDDGAIVVDQPPGELVVEVPALVSNFAVELSNPFPSLPVPMAAPLFPRKLPLSPNKLLLRSLVVPGSFHHLPFGGDEEVGVGAEVYPDGLLVFRERLGLHLADKNDVPMVPLPLEGGRLQPSSRGRCSFTFTEPMP